MDSLCHNVVVGRNLLTALRLELLLPGGGIEVFISSCEYVKNPHRNECIIPVALWNPVDSTQENVYCSPTVTAPVIVEGYVNVTGCVW